MAHVILDRAYYATARNAPPAVRPLVAAFVRELMALPTATAMPGDDEVQIPPGRPFWRHTFGTTGWCLYYTVGADQIIVRCHDAEDAVAGWLRSPAIVHHDGHLAACRPIRRGTS